MDVWRGLNMRKQIWMAWATMVGGAALIPCAPPAEAQPNNVPKSITESVGTPLRLAEGEFLSLARAMPAEKYSFVPSVPGGDFKGVRSFAEQVKHVACSNFAFFNEIEGKTPPEHCEQGGPSKARTKAELVRYLEDSIDYAYRVATTISDRAALERVEGPYAGPNTKLGLAVIAVWHVTDHYGQIVEYVRMNGIVPPASQPAPSNLR
jgi:hypothetical protein